jgi:putative hemolysin
MILLPISLVLLLVVVNGFFSAAEFSLVTVRVSRIRQLVEAGDARGKVVEELLRDLGRVVSGVQVGITLASLALGYVGEVTLAGLLGRAMSHLPGHWVVLASHVIAFVLAYGMLTVLQVVVGELVPKSISLARAERVALLIARPFHWFLSTFSIVIDALDGLAEVVVKLLGVVAPVSHSMVRSAEELQMLVAEARERGLLQAGQERFIQSAIELGRVQVREIMVPRPDIHALPADANLETVLRTFATTQRSRIPVYEGTLDHIEGFIHIKDLTWTLLESLRRRQRGLPAADFHLRPLLRNVLIVPESQGASELLVELRARRMGLAMVVDEFGGILGLATLEDILEQMVGEIHDEFDVVDRPLSLADGSMVFDAVLNLRDLETQYGITLPEETTYKTLGGYVLSRLGFIPRGGESFEADGYRFGIIEMNRRRVMRVKVRRLDPPSEGAEGPTQTQAPESVAGGSKGAKEERT